MSIEKMRSVSEQILNRLSAVKGEAATKQFLVLPMLEALGYDILNPLEVCPEFEADFATKKAGQKEKVDIAILLSSIPRIYFEIKAVDVILDGHEGQLGRYFNATQTVVLGVLTNGIEWRFFTDTVVPNVIDSKPFHIVRLDNIIDQGLEVITRFTKSNFHCEDVRKYATELLYTTQVAAFLRNQIDLKDKDPSEHFIKWILKTDKMYEGVVNNNVLERFKPIVKAGLTRVIMEIVRRSVAAVGEAVNSPLPQPETPAIIPDDLQTKASKIITTESELKVFSIVKELFEKSKFSTMKLYDAVTKTNVPVTIDYKDTQSYFGIYFNRSNWWIIRVVIDSKKPWVGFNLDCDDKVASLIPNTLVKLEPQQNAAFRISLTDVKDFYQLNKILLMTFEKVINERNKLSNSSVDND